MKGLLFGVGAIVVLYVIDQQYQHGKYTQALLQMWSQIRHSFGV